MFTHILFRSLSDLAAAHFDYLFGFYLFLRFFSFHFHWIVQNEQRHSLYSKLIFSFLSISFILKAFFLCLINDAQCNPLVNKNKALLKSVLCWIQLAEMSNFCLFRFMFDERTKAKCCKNLLNFKFVVVCSGFLPFPHFLL